MNVHLNVFLKSDFSWTIAVESLAESIKCCEIFKKSIFSFVVGHLEKKAKSKIAQRDVFWRF